MKLKNLLQSKYSSPIIHIVGWTVMCGLVICLFCFIRIEKLRHGYSDIQSGYTTEKCQTVGYDIVLRPSACYIYSIDQCSYGRGRREITQSGTKSCPDPIIKMYIDRAPLGTESFYYRFNARRNRYYAQD